MNKISKNKNELQLTDIKSENVLFSNVAQIIEQRKFNIISATNNQIVLMFWEIGKYINSAILGMERAEYGKKIVSTLSDTITAKVWQRVLFAQYKTNDAICSSIS